MLSPTDHQPAERMRRTLDGCTQTPKVALAPVRFRPFDPITPGVLWRPVEDPTEFDELTAGDVYIIYFGPLPDGDATHRPSVGRSC